MVEVIDGSDTKCSAEHSCSGGKPHWGGRDEERERYDLVIMVSYSNSSDFVVKAPMP